MRILESKIISQEVERLVVKANTHLRDDVLLLLNRALRKESRRLPRTALKAIVDNADIASKQKLAICQDTGLPVVFLELGNKVNVRGQLSNIITDAVERGYKKAYLRASIQKDAIFRKEKLSYCPCIIHTDIVEGNKLRITLFPKGFGSENKAKIMMFNPTVPLLEIENFIVDCVRQAGSGACPPYIIGVGIGGTQDFASLLAKKALLDSLISKNRNRNLVLLEQRLLKKINALNIGPFGFGGKATALAVRIRTYPTHIAGLPVAVNISCHALRSASVVI